MSDEESAFHEGFIQTIRAPNGRRPKNHHLVLDAIFRKVWTGSPSRDPPDKFGKWYSVYHQFRLWTLAGLWGQIMEALTKAGSRRTHSR